jgi:hypothetical protein
MLTQTEETLHGTSTLLQEMKGQLALGGPGGGSQLLHLGIAGLLLTAADFLDQAEPSLPYPATRLRTCLPSRNRQPSPPDP